MGELANLSGTEASKKMKQIADGQVAMFCTFTGGSAAETRPMATQAIDEDGTFWFFSMAENRTNEEVQKNPRVQLIYALPGSSEYLAVVGQAAVLRDREKVEQLWTPLAKTWFPEGKDDPRLLLIAVKPTAGQYWDTKNNKVVQMIKIALGAVTGRTMDDGVQGTLKA
jgi:general stress protein 26